MKYEIDLDRTFRHRKVLPWKISEYYDIMITSDNRLVDAIMVLITSMQSALKRQIRLWILHSDFTDEQQANLQRLCSEYGIILNLVKIDIEKFKDFNSNRLPRQTYFYFDAAEIVSNDTDRVLVVDVDTMFLKDISEMYDIDFEDTWLFAGNEYDNVPYSKYMTILNGDEAFNIEGLEDHECCFNSGVMLLNLEKFRENKINHKTFLKLKQESDKSRFYHDQLLINRFARGNVKLFPRVWYNMAPMLWQNMLAHFEQTDKTDLNEVYIFNDFDEKRTATIVHFCGYGVLKPWGIKIKVNSTGIDIDEKIGPVQRRYLKLWFILALKLKTHLFPDLYAQKFKYIESDKIRYYEKEYYYFKNYTNFLRLFYENSNYQKETIKFIKKGKYKKIAFWGLSQITRTLIKFFEKNNIKIACIYEKSGTQYENIPIIAKKIPLSNTPDLLILGDLTDLEQEYANFKNKIECLLITVYDLVSNKRINIQGGFILNTIFTTQIDNGGYYVKRIPMSVAINKVLKPLSITLKENISNRLYSGSYSDILIFDFADFILKIILNKSLKNKIINDSKNDSIDYKYIKNCLDSLFKLFITKYKKIIIIKFSIDKEYLKKSEFKNFEISSIIIELSNNILSYIYDNLPKNKKISSISLKYDFIINKKDDYFCKKIYDYLFLQIKKIITNNYSLEVE